MIALPTTHAVPVRFCPSKETLTVLRHSDWIASYSGGKDSTTLVTWIEWLRRIGMITVKKPRLVRADTGVEYPFLVDVSDSILKVLKSCGWECEEVRPETREKLYCQIFGRGLPPTHPGNKRFRWCSRATKTDPMDRFVKTLGERTLQLTGVRWGESDHRDGKLVASGCAAGGECGLPAPGEGKYAPIITWKQCKVIEWLSGDYEQGIRDVMGDLLQHTQNLVSVYDTMREQSGLWDAPPKYSSLRFGCIGCPAISTDKVLKSKHCKAGQWQHLRRIHEIWQALYLPKNRLVRMEDGRPRRGPIRMAVRKHYFKELLSIQKDSGVELVTQADIAFIRSCWRRNVYPRGWSAADELVEAPDSGLFKGAS